MYLLFIYLLKYFIYLLIIYLLKYFIYLLFIYLLELPNQQYTGNEFDCNE